MRQYLDLLSHVLEHGTEKGDRTGTGTRSVFGWQMRLTWPWLSWSPPEAAPALDRARAAVFPKATPTSIPARQQVTIWDEWADADGNLGPVYGHQWRRWQGADGRCLTRCSGCWMKSAAIRSRRLVISAWNVADLPKITLQPCHALFQFYVATGSCPASSTSAARRFFGVPFNIASYALLTHLVARPVILTSATSAHAGRCASVPHLERRGAALAHRALPRLMLNPK